jgi:Putative restriction endonuclease
VTTAEFVSFPFEEDKRYELDEGRLVVTDRPPYRHNRVLTNLMSAVGRFLEKSLIGEFLTRKMSMPCRPRPAGRRISR